MKTQPLSVIAILTAFLCVNACGPVEIFAVVPENAEKRKIDSLKFAPPFGRIAIVSHSTLNIKYLDATIDNHHRYAKKFGYDYIFRNGVLTQRYLDRTQGSAVFQLGLYWQKLQAVKEALEEGYDWVLWVDPDILFTNFETSLEDIIHKSRTHNEEFIIAGENFCKVNTGVFLVHQSAWSHQMLEHIASLHFAYKRDLLPEQLAVQDYIKGFARFGSDGRWSFTPDNQRNYSKKTIAKTVIIPQRDINSFYKGNFWLPGSTSDERVWQPGDFICHFAVRGKSKEPEMRALSACFKEKCSEHYEDNNQCLKACR
jgi:hypothetical protein